MPMLFLDPRDALRKNGVDLPRHDFSDTDTATHDDHIGCATLDLGCYNICGRIDDVPTGEEVNDQPGSLCDAALGHPDGGLLNRLKGLKRFMSFWEHICRPLFIFVTGPTMAASPSH